MNTTAPTREQVLALIAAGSTISDAAAYAGIHRNTIYNWLRSDTRFRADLSRAREAKALYWREQAEELAAGALDTIRSLMADPAVPASVRLKAAQSILNIVTVAPLETLPTYAPAPEFVPNSAQSTQPAEPEPQPEPEIVHNSAQQTFRRDTPKIGRNEACPCGSGRKYKHCCLGKTGAQAA